MGQSRLIVPDNSVMLPAFFPERLDYCGQAFDLSARAVKIVHAIRLRRVKAFAPELLRCEFRGAAANKVGRRSDASARDVDAMANRVQEFFNLPIIYIRGQSLMSIALDLVRREKIAPPDAWYVACAIHTGGELWISHEHEDGLLEKARAVHRQTYALTERTFA